MVIETEHPVHQGVARVGVAVGTIRSRLRLCLDVEGVSSKTRFLLSSLGIETLAGGDLAATALLDLVLLVRRDLKEVLLVGVAFLVATRWEVLIALVDLLILYL